VEPTRITRGLSDRVCRAVLRRILSFGADGPVLISTSVVQDRAQATDTARVCLDVRLRVRPGPGIPGSSEP
jgi:hypothetical protein